MCKAKGGVENVLLRPFPGSLVFGTAVPIQSVLKQEIPETQTEPAFIALKSVHFYNGQHLINANQEKETNHA
ncbi:MAG: hypothetical protein H6667_08660 [Ardenticatenaceae bacterium]|nr:hypothetical protein [Ardenticatenaceae bacterium]